MKRSLLAVALAAPLLLPAVARAGGTHAELHTALTLRVPEARVASDALVERAEEAGGYFLRRADTELTLKLPSAGLDDFVKGVGELGEIVERQAERRALTRSIARTRARLASREAMIGDYRDVLADASPKAVGTVEHAMLELVEEIEELRAELHALEHRARYATLDVSFRFRDRAPPRRQRPSPFAWVQRLDVVNLLEDFRGT